MHVLQQYGVPENLSGGDYRRDRRGQNIAHQICGKNI